MKLVLTGCLVTLVLLSVACGGHGYDLDAPLLDASALMKARTLIDASRQADLIRDFTCTGFNEAQIHPIFWASMDATEKRGLAISLAGICQAEHAGARIMLIDARSGRRLAQYRLGEFEVF